MDAKLSRMLEMVFTEAPNIGGIQIWRDYEKKQASLTFFVSDPHLPLTNRHGECDCEMCGPVGYEQLLGYIIYWKGDIPDFEIEVEKQKILQLYDDLMNRLRLDHDNREYITDDLLSIINS